MHNRFFNIPWCFICPRFCSFYFYLTSHGRFRPLTPSGGIIAYVIRSLLKPARWKINLTWLDQPWNITRRVICSDRGWSRPCKHLGNCSSSVSATQFREAWISQADTWKARHVWLACAKKAHVQPWHLVGLWCRHVCAGTRMAVCMGITLAPYEAYAGVFQAWPHPSQPCRSYEPLFSHTANIPAAFYNGNKPPTRSSF